MVRYARHKVDTLAAQEPPIAKSLVGIMLVELAAARQHMVLLGHMTALERIASFLLKLADRSVDDSRNFR